MKFELEKFKNPASEHYVIYTWVWNAPVTKDKIDSRLNEYKKAGIMGLYILPLPNNFRPGYMETFLEPQYLSEEFFELVKYALKKAKNLGMEIWLYDEGGWPSGGACGLTGKQNNEAYETTLIKHEINIKQGEEYVLKSPCIAVFNDTKRLSDTFIATEDLILTEYCAHKSCENHPNRIDGTNREAVDTFLNNTYSKYYKNMSEMFGKNLRAIFTDEPALLNNTIPKDLFSIFQTKYGYDLLDYLPFILDGNFEMNREQSQARIDYARLLGEMFCENYCKNISDWCQEHNIKMAGHLDIDHTAHSTENHAYFSHLNCLTQFDIPGIDVIWEQISYPYENKKPVKEGYEFFPRIASSAAHQNGSNLALSESFAVYGDGITPDEMRYVLNYQAVRGINIFNFMLTSIDSDNLNAMVERPVFSPEKPGFYNLRHINEYYARLSYLLKLGEPIIETALYNPCADFWAGNNHRDITADIYNKTGVALEKAHIPFDIIDDYAILNAEAYENGLKIGNATYRSIVVPECKYMPNDVKEKLKPFVNVDFNNSVLTDLDENLRVMARKLENSILYFIFNQGLKTVKQKINLPLDKLYEISINNGEVYSLENGEISLVCGDMAVLLLSDEKIPTSDSKVQEQLILMNLKPVCATSFKITEKGLENREIDVENIDEDFSGEIAYTSILNFSEKPSAYDRYRITLNDTSVSARMLINDKVAATFGMTPMKAVVNGSLFEKDNIIKIIVSNTASNEIISNHKVIESFPKAFIGSYDTRCVEFEKRRHKIRLGQVLIEKLL